MRWENCHIARNGAVDIYHDLYADDNLGPSRHLGWVVQEASNPTVRAFTLSQVEHALFPTVGEAKAWLESVKRLEGRS